MKGKEMSEFCVESYDPYFEPVSVLYMRGFSLGYKRGVWAYSFGERPYWVSETLGL